MESPRIVAECFLTLASIFLLLFVRKDASARIYWGAFVLSTVGRLFWETVNGSAGGG